MSPSLCASFSDVLGLRDGDVSDAAFTVSVGLSLDGAASEVGFGAEGSEINPE